MGKGGNNEAGVCVHARRFLCILRGQSLGALRWRYPHTTSTGCPKNATRHFSAGDEDTALVEDVAGKYRAESFPADWQEGFWGWGRWREGREGWN